MDFGPVRTFVVMLAMIDAGYEPCPVPAADGEPLGGKVLVGYVFRRPEQINFGLYTHLCHAFVTADEDGKIRPSRSCPSHELVADAHQANVRVLLSLGGWGWDKQFAAIVSQPSAEDRYVKAVLAIVDEYDYDGLDLDWEYPDTPAEIVGFERLCRRFRRELDELGQKKGRRLEQTMAAAANPPTLKWLTNELLVETMDWVNVMTYDFTGDWTVFAGHHSPLFASSQQPGTPRSIELSLKYLVERGMPANRLAVGLPLYGKGFAVAEPYASTKNAPKSNRSPARRRLSHDLQAARGTGLAAALGRRDQKPLGDCSGRFGRDWLRRRRVDQPQVRVGDSARLSRRLFLANRRRSDARRHESAASCGSARYQRSCSAGTITGGRRIRPCRHIERLTTNSVIADSTSRDGLAGSASSEHRARLAN